MKITISGDFNDTEVQEIMMAVRGIEARDRKKQIAVLVEAGGHNAGTALQMLERMFAEAEQKEVN